jgi:hypothetical protein
LADVRTTSSSHVDKSLLRDFPNSFVQFLDVVRNGINVLYTSVLSDDHILNLTGPESHFTQILNEMFVDADEFSR